MATSSFAKDITSQTMDINLSKGNASAQSLTTLCTDIFLIVIKMRDAEDLGETGALRKLILYYLKQFEKNCMVIGCAPETIEALKYALVAILDETVLGIPGPVRDYWIGNPMQLELFGDIIAGQEFFNKLNTLLKDPDNNKDALEVYYLCLSLGFEGKYKVGNLGEREEVITNLARVLVKSGNTRMDTLSPHAIRMTIMKSAGVKKAAMLPLWITGVGLAVIALVVWGLIWMISDGRAGAIAASVR